MIELEQQAGTFSGARRAEIFHRLGSLVTGREPSELVDYEDLKERLGLVNQSYLGMRAIPVDSIVGSVSRANDFDRDFHPRNRRARTRWTQLEHAFPEGDFPPIQVYKVGEVFFVIDGHHRVGIARQRGIEFIDAEITEVTTPYEITEDIDFRSIIHLEQERIFMEESGLSRSRPDVHIEFTRPQGYPELLESVYVHGYHLMMERGQVFSPEAIAAHWFETVYAPALGVIQEKRIREMIKCTDGDVFLWLNQRRREVQPDRGSLSFPEAARDEIPPRSTPDRGRARSAGRDTSRRGWWRRKSGREGAD